MSTRSTHVLEMADGHMTKRFRSWDRDEHRREWQALNVLAKFAPGLAPEPISADLDADPPTVTMTRLPGEPLAEQQITAIHLDALADTLNRLHACIPPGALARVQPQAWLSEGPVQRLRSRAAGIQHHHLEAKSPVLAAFRAADRWLDQVVEPDEPLTAVFGQGDSYLGNFLWDGSRLRVVDFEDSGLSDRTFELAGLIEHIGTWYESGIDADDIIRRFELTAAESTRLLFFRRGFAVFWLFLVHKRPGLVPSRQAERVLGLLGS